MESRKKVDLKSQYIKIKDQIETAMIETMESYDFVKEPIVQQFSQLTNFKFS